MKTVMVLMMVAVLLALGGAGVFMLRKPGAADKRSKGMARALALRVALSVGLFLFGWAMGWVHPTGLPTGG
jgi:succinate dehydrogenase/fumarate reductase flavoprotein subunit